MKFGELKSIGHNVADSLASGIGLLIGTYVMDIFGEAAATSEGFIVVDFLTGTTSGGQPSDSLGRAIAHYRDALPGLCASHGTTVDAFGSLSARYDIDRVYGRHFVVTVEDSNGRRSVDSYYGTPGKRLRQRR